MPRAFVVEPGVTTLHLSLRKACSRANPAAADVSIVISKAGDECQEPPFCPDECFVAWPKANASHAVWGGCCGCGESNCGEHGKVAATLAPCGCCGESQTPVVGAPVTKTYVAASIARGIATFNLDEDLIAAPDGWYRARVIVDGCEVDCLPILVRCSSVGVNIPKDGYCKVA